MNDQYLRSLIEGIRGIKGRFPESFINIGDITPTSPPNVQYPETKVIFGHPNKGAVLTATDYSSSGVPLDSEVAAKFCFNNGNQLMARQPVFLEEKYANDPGRLISVKTLLGMIQKAAPKLTDSYIPTPIDFGLKSTGVDLSA